MRKDDLNLVWDTVTDDLPPLIHALEKMVNQKSQSDRG